MTPGEHLKYRTNNTTETATSAMGQDMDIHTTLSSIMAMNVESADANQYTFTSTFDSCSVKMEPTSPGLSDSVISNALKEFLGKRTRITMTPMGKVLSIAMVDTPHFSNPMLSGLTKSFTKYSDMFGSFPEKSVKPGDTWTSKHNDTTDIGSGAEDTGAMARTGTIYTTTNATYTLMRFTDTLGHHCAVIGNTFTLKTDGDMSMMGMNMTIDGDGTGKTTFYFDADKGILVASENRTEISQNMAMTGQQNMVMPSSTTVTMHMTLMP